MKKFVAAFILLCFATTTYAAEKKAARNPSSEGACAEYAGEAVLGLVKGLGQDVKVASVKLVKTEKNIETYSVKLEGKGFSSPETNKAFTIKLWDGGDGCGFTSVIL